MNCWTLVTHQVQSIVRPTLMDLKLYQCQEIKLCIPFTPCFVEGASNMTAFCTVSISSFNLNGSTFLCAIFLWWIQHRSICHQLIIRVLLLVVAYKPPGHVQTKPRKPEDKNAHEPCSPTCYIHDQVIITMAYIASLDHVSNNRQYYSIDAYCKKSKF